MIVNLMERHVAEAYNRLKGSVPGFEDCPEHREDVIVYALNRLPAKYVLSDQGKAMTEVDLDGAQQRATIEVKVIDALRRVAGKPRAHHSHPPPGG